MRATHVLISALYFVHYLYKAELRCIVCARKASLRAAAGCLLLGWWSVYGFFATPVLVFRNLCDAVISKIDDDPSMALLMRARLELARQIPDFSDLKSSYPTGVPDENSESESSS